MIVEERSAKQVNDLMWEILLKLQDSLENIRIACSSEEHAAYHKAVGEIVRPVIFDVLEPLYKANPALKPADWD